MAEWTLLRPMWALLWGVPWLVLLWHWRRQQRTQSLIRPDLLRYLREGYHATTTQPAHASKGSRKLYWLWLPWTLLVLALCGPARQLTDQSLYQRDDVWVWMLDISTSMLADDLPPSRLVQARQILNNLATEAPGQRIALIAYAGDAYIITPPTADHTTLRFLLDELTPDVMPVAGSRPQLAVREGLALLTRQTRPGRLLLITDDIRTEQSDSILQTLAAQHQPLDVLAVGTPTGSPIPLPGGGVQKQRTGDLVIARTPLAALAELAATSGGQFARADQPASLGALHGAATMDLHQARGHIQPAQEVGYWLLPALLPCLILFRRGWLFVVLILPLGWVPAPARADEQPGWQAWQAGQWRQAAQQFTTPMWQGNAWYRAGNYPAAAQAYQNAGDSAQALYNLGNAYAKMQAIDEAISAYTAALQRDPALEDARYNRSLLLAWQHQQATDRQTTAPASPASGTATAATALPAADPIKLMRNRLRLQQQKRMRLPEAQSW